MAMRTRYITHNGERLLVHFEHDAEDELVSIEDIEDANTGAAVRLTDHEKAQIEADIWAALDEEE